MSEIQTAVETQTSKLDALVAPIFAEDSAQEAVAQETGFRSFSLAQPLLRAIDSLGFTQPTPVQAQAIPAAMRGGDWMVSSQTGSGKTAAFLIPTLNTLMGELQSKLNAFLGPRILVLCPTRELAQQVAADAINLVRHAKGVRIATVVGGMPFGKQIASLKGAAVVIATPGRLLDLANRRQVRLDNVACLVVDEADRMLDLGFAEDLDAIHALCADRAQTLMFSATFAPRIMQLAARVMREPGRLELASAQDKHADITQTLLWADSFSHKRKLLDHWLRDATLDQAIVFTSTQVDADSLADELEAEGYQAAALHGAMPQAVRNRRLKSLRDGRIRVLVATDVAARGIDVPTISHVINYGLPMKAEDYVHRIGRTGRAGRSGVAVTLAEYRDRSKVMAIERYIQQRFKPEEIAGLEPQPPKARSGRGGREGGREGGRRFGGESRGEGGFAARRSDAPRSEAPRSFADRGERPVRPAGDREYGDRPPRFERDRRDSGFPSAPRGEFKRSFGDASERRFDSPAPRRDGGRDGAREFNRDVPRKSDSRGDTGFAPRRESAAPRSGRDFGAADSRPRTPASRPHGARDSRPSGAGDSRPKKSFR